MNALSFLIYVNEKPFCVLYGTEEDAESFCNGRDAKYEAITTVMLTYRPSTKRGA